MITIYKKGTTEVRATIKPDSSSLQDYGLMRNDIVTLICKVPVAIPFAIGDYADILNKRYFINDRVPFQQDAKRNIVYTITFESWLYFLRRANYLTYDSANHLTEGKFEQRGRAIDFMNLLLANMERMFPGAGWSLGNVVDSDFVTMSFAGEKCLAVLGRLAEQFDTEYFLEGRKIYLFKRQLPSGVTLEYGQDKGLLKLSMQNADNTDVTGTVTRLYAFGSDKNIGTNYRNGAKYLRMPDSVYIEKNADLYGVFEHTVYFDDIYPRHQGVVTAVGDKVTFSDASLDFDVNPQILPGVTAQVTFNTGQCAGQTFNIDSFNNGTKTFVIVANEGETVNLPTDVLKPAPGDKYVIIGIEMPLIYITNAEAELKARAQAWLADNGKGKVNYPVSIDPLFLKRNRKELQVGYTYRLLSTAHGINDQVRVVGYKRKITSPYEYTSVDLADSVTPRPAIVKLLNLI
ncbi:phage tail protein [Mucilaginibacter sp.]|uniref:phage tail protein n=1 Tax=Mucilaginibacter sp. TaxID=1882438 RepID=UPI003262FA24